MIRSRLVRVIAVMILVLLLTLTFLGCKTTSTDEKTAETTTASDKTAETTTKAEDVTAEPTEEPVDPLAIYDPMIEVTTVASQGADVTFEEGQDWDNNYWSMDQEPATGIKIQHLWAVPTDQFESKLNVAIASGDIPDFFRVTGPQLMNLAEAGIIAEMGPLLEKYAADITNETIAQDPSAIKSCTIDGKVMALPVPGSPLQAASVVWIRTDWLENLGLGEPETLEDFLAISTAFAKNDPDQNGEDDTLGFSFPGNSDLEAVYQFSASYHVYPRLWVMGDSGKVEFGGIQDSVKTVLAQLQTMYQNGEIDKEFGVKDSAKFAEEVAAGKIGMFIDIWWTSFGSIQDSLKNNADATWKAFPYMSVDSSPAKVPGPFTTTSYYVSSIDSKNPEVPIKLANYVLDKYYVKNEVVVKPEWNNVTAYQYASVWLEPPLKNLAVFHRIKQFVETGDESILLPDDKNNYDVQQTYWESKDPFGFAVAAAFGPEDSSLEVIDYYRMNDLVENTLYAFAPTQTMVEKQSALDDLQAQTYMKIIMGDGTLDDFDKFVEDWLKAGGTEITDEVNAWYSANK